MELEYPILDLRCRQRLVLAEALSMVLSGKSEMPKHDFSAIFAKLRDFNWFEHHSDISKSKY